MMIFQLADFVTPSGQKFEYQAMVLMRICTSAALFRATCNLRDLVAPFYANNNLGAAINV